MIADSFIVSQAASSLHLASFYGSSSSNNSPGLCRPKRVHHPSSFIGIRISKLGLNSPLKKPRSRVLQASIGDSVLSTQPTLYELLGLSHDVGMSDIKQAYRQMARKYHPDVCPSDGSEESTRRFIEIQQAYETLSDPRRRAMYDNAIISGLGTGASGRRRWDLDVQEMMWRYQWEEQLNGLKRKGSNTARKSESWGARMRKQNEQMCQTV